ncbi:amidohydrolase [Leptolyngbya sp. KIOST-1]|uniref:amidohydrolase n=1 Tax=Leptolyngbya sp. KIOST-1 TaxID=1229172 RepID=UPI00068C7FB6|nr:amidohydrolase [Leptolyngbya sp. KIOST-1]
MTDFKAFFQLGCGCASFLADTLEAAGHNLIQRRNFLKLSLGTAGILTTSHYLAQGGNASMKSTPAASQPLVAATGDAVDTIYFGGPIVTMVADGDRVEALAVKDGRIMAAGRLASVKLLQGPTTTLVDLAGRCLMPGFIDPHSHVVMQSAKFAVANLDPYPIGEVQSIEDIQRILREEIATKNLAPGQWVIGWGYDDTAPEGMRHPLKEDLDAVSTEHPILLVHISNHLCACNSLLLDKAGISASTPDPEGGRIQRQPGSQEPNGVLEEAALMLVAGLLPTPTPEKALELLEAGLRYYAAAGITTAQDGSTGKGAAALLEAMAQADKLPIDVVSYPLYAGVDDALFDQVAADLERFQCSSVPTGRFRYGGIKLVVDGSIQGYTAYLSQPFYVEPGETQPTADKCRDQNAEHLFISSETAVNSPAVGQVPSDGYRGYPSMEVEDLAGWVERCDARGVPMLVHTNGDAATDILIEAVAIARSAQPRPDLRTTIIHAQMIREDQLDVAAAQGLVPSFFPIHIPYWGDRHRDLFLGPERAARISPAQSALQRNMKFTLHHDAPIAGIGMLPVAAAAVNRVTSGGADLGPDQRITPFEALRGITADAAWQYFEEDHKGTLEVGKLADLVVLSADPLAADPMKMGEIQVLETIKAGQTIYRQSESP